MHGPTNSKCVIFSNREYMFTQKVAKWIFTIAKTSSLEGENYFDLWIKKRIRI